MKALATAASVYTDTTGLSELKRQARNPSGATNAAATRQFEAMFVEMMLQSMRRANPSSEFLDGSQGQMFRELHDKQLAQSLAATGKLGFGRLLARQLQQQKPADTRTRPALKPAPKALPLQRPQAKQFPLQRPQPLSHSEPLRLQPLPPSIKTPTEFIDQMRPHAEVAAAELGVAPEVLLAQSALESGWGKRVMQHPGGRSSYNLFGIKSSNDWQGPKVNTKTLEYASGTVRHSPSSFRAYDSFAQSFRDYVNFIKGNPRYAQALRNASDANAYLSSLQQAGYATDPQYAYKVQRIMQHDAIRASAMVASNKPVANRA